MTISYSIAWILIVGAFVGGALLAAITFWITSIYMVQKQIEQTMLKKSDAEVLFESLKEELKGAYRGAIQRRAGA